MIKGTDLRGLMTHGSRNRVGAFPWCFQSQGLADGCPSAVAPPTLQLERGQGVGLALSTAPSCSPGSPFSSASAPVPVQPLAQGGLRLPPSAPPERPAGPMWRDRRCGHSSSDSGSPVPRGLPHPFALGRPPLPPPPPPGSLAAAHRGHGLSRAGLSVLVLPAAAGGRPEAGAGRSSEGDVLVNGRTPARRTGHLEIKPTRTLPAVSGGDGAVQLGR